MFSAAARHASAPTPASSAVAARAHGAVSAGWQPVVGRDGRPIGFRLGLHGHAPGQTAAALLDEMLDGFRAEGASGMPHGLVVLAPFDLPADESLAYWGAPRNVLLEVGQRWLGEPDVAGWLLRAQRHGVRLALRLDGAQLPLPEQLAPFQYLVADGMPPRPRRDIATLVLGACTPVDADNAFAAGASGVIGWPVEPPTATAALHPQQRALLELIRLVQGDADVGDIEAGFKREPVLAYMLLTLANSPAFMRAQPIASLANAIQLLGYQRLVKWLVLLLVIASKSSKALPAIYCAVVRGLLLENCAAAIGAAPQIRDECFVVGAFSLLDRVTGRSLSQLTADLVLPDPVQAAITGAGGPYAPYVALAQALEGGDAAAMRHAGAVVGLDTAAVNAALLKALATNDALQTLV